MKSMTPHIASTSHESFEAAPVCFLEHAHTLSFLRYTYSPWALGNTHTPNSLATYVKSPLSWQHTHTQQPCHIRQTHTSNNLGNTYTSNSIGFGSCQSTQTVLALEAVRVRFAVRARFGSRQSTLYASVPFLPALVFNVCLTCVCVQGLFLGTCYPPPHTCVCVQVCFWVHAECSVCKGIRASLSPCLSHFGSLPRWSLGKQPDIGLAIFEDLEFLRCLQGRNFRCVCARGNPPKTPLKERGG